MRDVQFALIHADDKESEVLEIARRYYTQALGAYNLAFLESATDEFKGALAGMLVAAARPQQIVELDESLEW